MNLPEELVIEILVRLPAKHVRLCNCVSKPWRAIIASRPFQAAYRKHHGCLMLYWSDRVQFINSSLAASYKRQFNFFYSPLRRFQDSTQDFTLLPKLPVHGFYARVTQLVNGLLCVGETEGQLMTSRVHGLTVYNVCTGESMRIPEPERYPKTGSTFHLGYDPLTRTYKLLRMIFLVDDQTQAKLMNCPPQAHIMTLQSPGLVSTWRKLEPDEACSHEWMKLKCSVDGSHGSEDPKDPRPCCYMSERHGSEEARTFPGDGVLCWFRPLGGLVLFDLNKERFRWFKLPEDIQDRRQQIVPRAQFKQERPSVSVWVVPKIGEQYRPPQCFVMEDEESNRWSKHRVELLGELEGLAVSNGEMLLVNPRIKDESRAVVYCYGAQGKEQVEKFWVGKLPDKRLALGDFRCFAWDAYFNSTIARLFCLLDTNHLYLPLHQVLSG